MRLAFGGLVNAHDVAPLSGGHRAIASPIATRSAPRIRTGDPDDPDDTGSAPADAPTAMSSDDDVPPHLVLPPRLIAASRAESRRLALAYVERVAAVDSGQAIGAVVLDLRDTIEVDASGLGILVLLHRKARERGLAVRLLHASEPVRELLELTRLTQLFELDE